MRTYFKHGEALSFDIYLVIFRSNNSCVIYTLKQVSLNNKHQQLYILPGESEGKSDIAFEGIWIQDFLPRPNLGLEWYKIHLQSEINPNFVVGLSWGENTRRDKTFAVFSSKCDKTDKFVAMFTNPPGEIPESTGANSI